MREMFDETPYIFEFYRWVKTKLMQKIIEIEHQLLFFIDFLRVPK